MAPCETLNKGAGYRRYPAVIWLGALVIIMTGVSVHTALGQSLSGAFGKPRKDGRLPVQIESDVLEVLQNKKQAIFTGNVIAIRGPVKLRSSRLVVHYTEKRAGTARSKTDITRLNAYGKVVVTNGNKRATGQWAVLQMRTGKVTMGDAVVLTENETVIRGSRLALDLRTGKSRLIGGKTKKGKGRVLSIFVPDPVK